MIRHVPGISIGLLAITFFGVAHLLGSWAERLGNPGALDFYEQAARRRCRHKLLAEQREAWEKSAQRWD